MSEHPSAARVMQLSGGSLHLELHDVVANDRVAVALFTGRGTRNRLRLENPTVLRIRLESGEPVEVHEFEWDLYAVDAFWG
jgi:hypothetical protein